MTTRELTVRPRNTAGRTLERERDESLRVARGIIFGLMFSPLFWIVLVVGSQQVGALIDLR